MASLSTTAAYAQVGVVLAGWVVFALVFVLRERPPVGPEKRRDPSARVGLAIQAVGYALVWSFRRPIPSSFVPLGPAGDAALAAVTLLLVVGSVWMVAAAVRTLGKQWSVAARLVAEHELVTAGPYRIVRHPIYAGMLGMLVATGFALSRWPAVPTAVVVYTVGTVIRFRSEERLLRGAFVEAYDRYSREVPALLPWPRPRQTG